ncbi:MAG: helix-hairpin-helix domain-containing protein, partial [Candidatus Acidiferrales bacterium]
PEQLYEELCRRTGQSQDICVLDTFRAAVAQARNPRLPARQRSWWYWSRLRKASEEPRQSRRPRS